MQSRRRVSCGPETVEGWLLRGPDRVARVHSRFDLYRESIIATTFGGSEELPDSWLVRENGRMKILQGGSDLQDIEQLVLELDSGERWRVQVDRNWINGAISWEIGYLGSEPR